MMNRLIQILMFLLLTGSLILHVWEYHKIREHDETLALQAEIEVKRIALLVLHQEVLQNMAKELDVLREQKTEPLELKWEETEP